LGIVYLLILKTIATTSDTFSPQDDGREINGSAQAQTLRVDFNNKNKDARILVVSSPTSLENAHDPSSHTISGVSSKNLRFAQKRANESVHPSR
jgi:hypothetical protein